MKKIRIIHIINSFEFGGAEAMLCNLLLRTDRDRFEPSVVALIDDLTVAGPILQAGIPLKTMGMKPGVPDPRGILRLAKHLRRERPTIVQTWMDHSNLIGGLAAKLVPGARVVWGVHHSNHVAGLTKRSTLLTVNACAVLSHRVPARVILCSEHSRKLYAERGFAARKLKVIPNGFDTELFHPDSEARSSVRHELGIDANAKLIGLVARHDPLKDHANFLRAAAKLIETHPEIHFLMCGANVNEQNTELMDQIRGLRIDSRCHLLGPRRDVPRLYAAMDLNSSSSISEAFPLAVGEAMACGVPCVATDVGDSALMIGDTGRVVPPGDSGALAQGWAELLALNAEARMQMGIAARARVRELFDLTAVTRRYEEVYRELAAAGTGLGVPRPVAPCDSKNLEGADVLIPRVVSKARMRTWKGGTERHLRILLVVESSGAGTGRHVFDLAEGLMAHGCLVHLIYSTGRMDERFKGRLGELKGLASLALPMRTGPHPSDFGVIKTVHRYLKEHGPFDIIHGHSSKGGAIARLAAMGTGTAAFYTLHGLIMMDPGLSRIKRWFYLAIELALSLRTSRIIAVSPEEARAAVKTGMGRSRIITVPNGVGPAELTARSAARRALGLGDEAMVIGFVGRIVDQKAPHVLVEAFAATAAVVPGVQLVIVGAGPLLEPMQELGKKLKVADKIHWLGERDAREVFAAFDIFALSSRKEGLPYVILEAMAAGLPIVATVSAGVEILIDPGVNGFSVPTDDIKAFTAALVTLASEAALVLRYGQASLKKASDFTIKAMVDRTLAVYQDALRRKL